MRYFTFLLLFAPLCCLAQKQDKVEYHKHFVIKEWEGFRESGDTLIYISPKIVRGTKGPRAKAFFLKHPEVVKYLKEEELLLFQGFAKMGWPCPEVQTEPSKKKAPFSVMDFKNNICIFKYEPD